MQDLEEEVILVTGATDGIGKVAEFSSLHERIDVLVNDAGAVFRLPVWGPDYIERTFALHHLAGFLPMTSFKVQFCTTPGSCGLSGRPEAVISSADPNPHVPRRCLEKLYVMAYMTSAKKVNASAKRGVNNFTSFCIVQG